MNKEQLLASEALKKKYGNELESKVDAFFEGLAKGEVDDDFNFDCVMTLQKDAVHQSMESHYKGKYSNEHARNLVKTFGIDKSKVEDPSTGKWSLESATKLAFEKLGTATAEVERLKTEGGTDAQMKKAYEDLKKAQEKLVADTAKQVKDAEMERDTAVSDKESYISQSKVRGAVIKQMKETYKDAKLREGVSVELLADKYINEAEAIGMTLKVNDSGGLGAFKKDANDQAFLIGSKNVDFNSHIRSTMDPVYNPVQKAGKSWSGNDLPGANAGGEAEERTMDDISKEIFKDAT